MKELFIEAEIEIVIFADDLLTDALTSSPGGFDVEEEC